MIRSSIEPWAAIFSSVITCLTCSPVSEQIEV
jgi:hypothetical protein